MTSAKSPSQQWWPISRFLRLALICTYIYWIGHNTTQMAVSLTILPGYVSLTAQLRACRRQISSLHRNHTPPPLICFKWLYFLLYNLYFFLVFSKSPAAYKLMASAKCPSQQWWPISRFLRMALICTYERMAHYESKGCVFERIQASHRNLLNFFKTF